MELRAFYVTIIASGVAEQQPKKGSLKLSMRHLKLKKFNISADT
jgi:hypothetical protein